MLSQEQRNFLYNPKNFDGVSLQTRTDIIGLIDLDIDGLAQEEGGKFTHEELCKGLHYLLTTNKDLQDYIEQNKSQTSSSDPFVIPSLGLKKLGEVSCLPLALAGGNNDAVLFVGCVYLVLCILTALFWVFWFTYGNILDMLKNEEPSFVKITKIIASLIVFIGVMAPLAFFMPSLPGFYGLGIVFAFFCGAVATALFSYANKKILCFPNKQENLNESLKPSQELLEELGCIEKTLTYARKGDNKEVCMEFAKTVVRLHIKSISKPENVKKTSSLGGYGSFHKSVITEQPANDANQNTEDDSLRYGAST